jgi:hypothetical protein
VYKIGTHTVTEIDAVAKCCHKLRSSVENTGCLKSDKNIIEGTADAPYNC